MILGFTGSRKGMTVRQSGVIAKFLIDNSILVVNHGASPVLTCADWEVDRIATELGIRVHRYPPKSKRPVDMLSRDRLVISVSDAILAAPNSFKEVLRSGTWATVRYCYAERKPMYAVWPCGCITELLERPWTHRHLTPRAGSARLSL
jgi:hypothetical protein